MANYTVPSTALYVATDGSRRTYIAEDVIPMEEAVLFQMPGAVAATPPAALNAAATAEVQALIDAGDAATLAAAGVAAEAADLVVEARTATVTGATTGTVSATTDFVVVTSANADHIIVLPEPVIGKVVTLKNGGTGYELRTSDPATISINGGAEASAESAIGANVTVVCRCVSATAWIATSYATNGAITATQVAAAA